MNQNQCVPDWDLDDVGPMPPPPPPTKSLASHSLSNPACAGHDTSMLDYEMAELTWKDGQLTMHGLGMPRVPSKNNLGGAWTDKPTTRAGGTLESIVNQATHKTAPPFTQIGPCDNNDNHVPFFTSNAIQCGLPPSPVSMGMDALVPTTNDVEIGASKPMGECSKPVGSCSLSAARVPVYSEWTVSASGSDRWQSVKRPADETSDQLRSITNNEMTSTSFGASLDNTTTYTNTRTFTVDDQDHDSVCHSRPQRERGDEEENEKKGTTEKSTSLTKRSRAAAVHNQSERNRRDKINQRMKTLQKLVPNSNKTDKASMLDEVIDYLKQLQAQVQMLNTMRLPSMMLPLAIQQQLQMSMMAPMAGMGMGLGIGMGMDQMNMGISAIGPTPNVAGLSPAVMNPAAFMSLAAATSDGGDRQAMPQAPLAQADPLSTYLACQSNPMTSMDAYSRMAAMYQQLHQQLQQTQHQQPGPSSNT